MAETIEDIILDQDQRGVSHLRGHVPTDFCAQAAQYILDHPGPAIIATGFYILSAGKHETDGPPGAIAIGNALKALGPGSDLRDRPPFRSVDAGMATGAGRGY